MRKLILPTLALIAVLATAAVASGGSDSPARQAAKAPKKNIVETAVGAGNFDTLVSLVQSAGLAETLSGKGPYTVFAPTDKAFAKVPAETLEALGTLRISGGGAAEGKVLVSDTDGAATWRDATAVYAP